MRDNELYENAAELLANCTNQPIGSFLVYETLDAIIALLLSKVAKGENHEQ